MENCYEIVRHRFTEEYLREQTRKDVASFCENISNYTGARRYKDWKGDTADGKALTDAVDAFCRAMAYQEILGVRPASIVSGCNSEEAVAFMGAQLLEALHGPEDAVTKQTVCMGRIKNWCISKGFNERMLRGLMHNAIEALAAYSEDDENDN